MVILHALQKRKWKGSVITHRKTIFKLRNRTLTHSLHSLHDVSETKICTTENILAQRTGPQPMKTWRGIQPYFFKHYAFVLKNHVHDNRCENKKRESPADVGEKTTYMVNMVHWDLKYVWYVYYASSNTGAESWRKEGESRKEERLRWVNTVSFSNRCCDRRWWVRAACCWNL